ncbi:MAG: RluA family pseudouridine synthase [bacterium]|nr:RluA family pseudouridine synthase [bacterium]
MDLNIVYEDNDILVLNKPAGISVHKTHPLDPHQTLADLVVEKYPKIKDVGEDPLRPGLVHRLDKDTSGLIIIAKNQPAFSYFKGLFQNRTIKKTYLALVHGQLKEKSGTIDAPLGKLGTKQTTQIKGKRDLQERNAVTNYEVIQEFPHFSLLQVSPLTGRTHQIRVHLKSIGHSIVCDPLYGGKNLVCPPELGRLFLHAQKLEFNAPSGQSMVLEADPPGELTDFLNSSIISQ